MMGTRNHTCQPHPPQCPRDPKDEEATSYTELLTLRQKAADHEAKLAAQKEKNRKMQEIMVVMQKAMETAGIHVHPKTIPRRLGKTSGGTGVGGHGRTRAEKAFLTLDVMDEARWTEPTAGKRPHRRREAAAASGEEEVPLLSPKKNNKAQDPRKVRSDFPKGKCLQRGRLLREHWPSRPGGPKEQFVHQEPEERGRKNHKHPLADLR
uniref:Uncharacterized protein n=1 Tax=Cannabis sativa TaxID=3483 RepID=A0A803QNJ1_CANSA